MSKSVAERCAGALPIDTFEEGIGDTLVFPVIPDYVIGGFQNDISGLDITHPHPLKGAKFFTKRNPDKTYHLTIFQGDLSNLAESFGHWVMAFLLLRFADSETAKKIASAVKEK